MVISYTDQGEVPVYPPYCRCNSPHFQKRGRYLRVFAQVFAWFFFCTECKTHITMLPRCCVPFKQYPAVEIQPVLDEGNVSGRTVHELDRQDRPGVGRSTMYRWAGEWSGYSQLLGSMATEKFARVLLGSACVVYQRLRQWYSCSGSFLEHLQGDLCRRYPPMGVFRPLIDLSDSDQNWGQAFLRRRPPGARAKS